MCAIRRNLQFRERKCLNPRAFRSWGVVPSHSPNLNRTSQSQPSSTPMFASSPSHGLCCWSCRWVFTWVEIRFGGFRYGERHQELWHNKHGNTHEMWMGYIWIYDYITNVINVGSLGPNNISFWMRNSPPRTDKIWGNWIGVIAIQPSENCEGLMLKTSRSVCWTGWSNFKALSVITHR